MRGRKKSEDTRLAILRAAAEVFSQRPFHEVLTDQLTARLKMGKGTLYRYFVSKEALYFATIVDGLEGMQDAIAAVTAREAPLERTIEELARTMIGYFWERRDFFVLLHRHEAKLDPGERAEWQRRREDIVGLIASRLATELRDRGAGLANPRLAAEMLLGMIRSVCMYRDASDSIEDLTRLVTGVFLRGVGTTRARPAAPPPARARLRPARRA